MKKREWYSIKNEAETADIMIYDIIGEDFWGEGVSAKGFAEDVKDLKVDVINLHINSPGGSVFDGIAIYNLLKSHKARVNVQIDGMALSIASVIAMAGDSVTMAENAMMMIHDPWTMVMGSADDMRKEADTLDKVKSSLITSYGRTGKPLDEIADLMSDETWMTAAEALEMGFADALVEKVNISNSFDLSGFKHAPKNLAEKPQDAPKEPVAPAPSGSNIEYAKAVLRLEKVSD
jgi:ATP-dependent Clp endopeptidase proteolytic subunit ClpP